MREGQQREQDGQDEQLRAQLAARLDADVADSVSAIGRLLGLGLLRRAERRAAELKERRRQAERW